jgi:hypothetical protein
VVKLSGCTDCGAAQGNAAKMTALAHMAARADARLYGELAD